MKLILKIKRNYYFLITTILIFFLAIIFLNIYSQKVIPKIDSYAKQKIKANIYSKITKNLDNIYNYDLDKLFILYQNNDKDIIYVDYNLKSSYELLNIFVSNIKNDISNMEKINIPFMMQSDNIFLSNLGPKITIYYESTNSIIANLKTKITNYGLNNALIEIYIHLEIDNQITMPIKKDIQKEKFDILISAKVINGKVPSLYGNTITQNSSILDIPLK